MKINDFDFNLPDNLIAAFPARPRDSARLLRVESHNLHNHYVRDLPELLAPGDLLVFNDTRVIPARLKGMRGQARVELMLHKPLADGRWRAFARPAKRLRPGDQVVLGPEADATVTVAAKGDSGEVILDFGDQDVPTLLWRCGEIPLPPYIPRPHGPEASDAHDYQTVFASRDGAVAAPTAGLHFTPELLTALAARGVCTAAVILHVGAGTFLPVKTEVITEHRMHAEYGEISVATARTVADTRAAGGRIVAVGTTALRLLESAVADDGTLRPFAGETALFILPGYRFQIVDRLLTNFHLPRSTLYMLVSAFAGVERMRTAYAHAIASGYRFYSYGDTSLLDRNPEP